jgi:hypothetical protein
MAVSRDRQLLALGTRYLPNQLHDCRAVAEAFIDSGRVLTRSLVLQVVSNPTDYDLARRQSISAIRSLIQRWNTVRDGNLRADVIRAVAHLHRLEQACKSCLRVNTHNLAEGGAFVCRAAELVSEQDSTDFRYRLNHEGKIVRTS